MDENEARQEESAEVATPIFSVYRRGYDPDQVDRYVADQQRRLDDSQHRASESERKLAAAVGQLRELHRRVAVYESEQRVAQPPALDSLGERVQRILQEAWEGAYNLRQEAERDVSAAKEAIEHELEARREKCSNEIEELRQVASQEAADLVDEATRRALVLRDEMDRRRQAYLERVERDRQQAVSQISYLYDQRQLALSELARLQAIIQTTVEEMVRSPLGKPTAAILDAAVMRDSTTDDEGPDVEDDANGLGIFDGDELDVLASLNETAAAELTLGSSESDVAGAVRHGDVDALDSDKEGVAGAEPDLLAQLPGSGINPESEPASESGSDSGESDSQSKSEVCLELAEDEPASIDAVLDDVAAPWERAGESEAEIDDGFAGVTVTPDELDETDSTTTPSPHLPPVVDSSGSQAEIPTGPMEKLGYGYGYEQPTMGYTPVATVQPDRSGVYDAEADGWV